MKKKWFRTVLMAGGVAALAAGTAVTVAVLRGRDTGIITVSNVLELIDAVATGRQGDTIIVSEVGSPYHLDEQPCMSRVGHLYITKGLSLRGRTGRPEDVVLVGSTNRLIYINAPGCKISSMMLIGGNCINNINTTNKPKDSLWGGGIYLGLASNECRIANCIFTNNTAFRGGAIAALKSSDNTSTIVGCKFFGNKAMSHGGAIYNGSRVYSALFAGNVAQTNGGAIANGYVEDSVSKGNKARKGSDLSECKAYRYVLSDIGEPNISRFYNCEIDRGRITITNGVLFSGFFDIRNSLVANGENYDFAKGIEFGYKPVQEEGGEMYRIPPQILCSTIVSNVGYRFFSPPKVWDPDNYAHINISNCLFYGNTILGMKINMIWATNGTYKTIGMSKGEKLAALGWNGVFPERGTTNYVYSYDKNEYPTGIVITVLHDWIQYTKDIVYPQVPSGYKDDPFSVSWQAYYYAMGWDGNSPSFLAKYVEMPILPISAKYVSSLYENISEQYEWRKYYEDNGWDGVSDYAGSLPYDIGKKETQYIKIANSIVSIEDEITTNCVNTYLYNRRIFNPKFALSLDASNPYAIDKSSPACHLSFGSLIEQIPIDNWMLTSKDLRGSPRTYGGGLDIGAYQAAVFYPFVMFIR